jgi:hypothetical protein
MNSSWLVEMANVWAYHAHGRVEVDTPFPTEAVHEYWIRCRTRFDGWNSILNHCQRQIRSLSMSQRVRSWQKLKSVIEEVLLAEPLTRVGVAIAARLEERQIDNDSRAILHNIYTSHCEVRSRCLRLIVDGIERGISEADELNSLRHYLEHWTDMLLGYFASSSSAYEYCFTEERVTDFAGDYSEQQLGDRAQVVWSLLIASCRTWLDKHVDHKPVSPKANRQVCDAAMAMIHPDLFDSMGLMQSHLIQRIERGLQSAGETLERLESGNIDALSMILQSNGKTCVANRIA